MSSRVNLRREDVFMKHYVAFPKMVKVRQKIPAPKIEDYISAIRRELRKAGLHERIKPGSCLLYTSPSPRD